MFGAAWDVQSNPGLLQVEAWRDGSGIGRKVLQVPCKDSVVVYKIAVCVDAVCILVTYSNTHTS
jgi:hypothetical protein